jgi:hypothetical protein
MATLTGFTRPSDPINGDQLSGQVSAAVGKTLDVQVDTTTATATGTITEADRSAIQAAINAYIYLPPSVGSPVVTTKVALQIGNVDNTHDVDKPVSTAAASVLNATLATARTIMEASGSHIAAKVAGTYWLGMGDPLAVSGTGVLYPIQAIGLIASEFPSINGLPPKLRIRGALTVNGTAPTGNFTVGLYPVTKGGGGAGVSIYNLGAVIAASQPATISAPVSSRANTFSGADFDFPADGVYCLGVLTTATVATSSLVHVVARLQIRNA